MFKSTDCILIIGRRGCGKSFLAKKIQDIYPRRVIFDTLHEYPEENAVYSFDELCEKLKGNFSEIVFKFDPEARHEELFFNHALRVIYYLGNTQIVLEEIQVFSSPHHLPSWLRNCLLTGRHRNLSLLFTTQRPGELNKTILSQCSHIFAGQIHEKNDLAYCSSFLKDRSVELLNIPERKFLYFRPGEPIQIVNNDLKGGDSTSEKSESEVQL